MSLVQLQTIFILGLLTTVTDVASLRQVEGQPLAVLRGGSCRGQDGVDLLGLVTSPPPSSPMPLSLCFCFSDVSASNQKATQRPELTLGFSWNLRRAEGSTLVLLDVYVDLSSAQRNLDLLAETGNQGNPLSPTMVDAVWETPTRALGGPTRAAPVQAPGPGSLPSVADR